MNTIPFPHTTGSWFDPDLLAAVRGEVPSPHDPRWRRYDNPRERKLEGPRPMGGPSTRTYFDRLAGMADGLADQFGLPPLHMETTGGGYHLVPPGGYLEVHSDFSRSPESGRYRRLNVLTYLNDWQEGDGGELELWDDHGPVERIPPTFGTTVAFVTSSGSWHGHPAPTRDWRVSLAAYFFTDGPPAGFVDQSTVWHP